MLYIQFQKAPLSGAFLFRNGRQALIVSDGLNDKRRFFASGLPPARVIFRHLLKNDKAACNYSCIYKLQNIK